MLQAQSIGELTLTIDQGYTGTVCTAFTDTVEISFKEFGAPNLEAFLNYLRGKLIHTILCRIANDMVDSTAAIGGESMLTNMLNAPVAKLAMRNKINASKDFVDTGTLSRIRSDMQE
jgi:hypothetical protein